jgi:hypothetical protein
VTEEQEAIKRRGAGDAKQRHGQREHLTTGQ